jgi:hypothetical protein
MKPTARTVVSARAPPAIAHAAIAAAAMPANLSMSSSLANAQRASAAAPINEWRSG